MTNLSLEYGIDRYLPIINTNCTDATVVHPNSFIYQGSPPSNDEDQAVPCETTSYAIEANLDPLFKECAEAIITSNPLPCEVDEVAKMQYEQIRNLTLLHLAVMSGNIDAIKTLLPLSDRSLEDSEGFTPAHHAMLQPLELRKFFESDFNTPSSKNKSLTPGALAKLIAYPDYSVDCVCQETLLDENDCTSSLTPEQFHELTGLYYRNNLTYSKQKIATFWANRNIETLPLSPQNDGKYNFSISLKKVKDTYAAVANENIPAYRYMAPVPYFHNPDSSPCGNFASLVSRKKLPQRPFPNVDLRESKNECWLVSTREIPKGTILSAPLANIGYGSQTSDEDLRFACASLDQDFLLKEIPKASLYNLSILAMQHQANFLLNPLMVMQALLKNQIDQKKLHAKLVDTKSSALNVYYEKHSWEAALKVVGVTLVEAITNEKINIRALEKKLITSLKDSDLAVIPTILSYMTLKEIQKKSGPLSTTNSLSKLSQYTSSICMLYPYTQTDENTSYRVLEIGEKGFLDRVSEQEKEDTATLCAELKKELDILATPADEKVFLESLLPLAQEHLTILHPMITKIIEKRLEQLKEVQSKTVSKVAASSLKHSTKRKKKK